MLFWVVLDLVVGAFLVRQGFRGLERWMERDTCDGCALLDSPRNVKPPKRELEPVPGAPDLVREKKEGPGCVREEEKADSNR